MAADIAKEIGKKFEKTPGFGYVAFIVSAMLATVLESTDRASDWSFGLYALAIALVAYWSGGFLDALLFEPFYGLPGREHVDASRIMRLARLKFIKPLRDMLARRSMAQSMAAARTKAALQLHQTNQLDIYKTAKKLLSNTDAWEGRIKLSLDFSKTARTLIIPSFLLLLWEVADRIFSVPGPAFLAEHPSIAWLSHPCAPASVGLVSTVTYINLRLRHMQWLYQELAKAPTFSFQIAVLPACGTVQTLWSVGDKVIAQNQIPVCVADTENHLTV